MVVVFDDTTTSDVPARVGSSLQLCSQKAGRVHVASVAMELKSKKPAGSGFG